MGSNYKGYLLALLPRTYKGTYKAVQRFTTFPRLSHSSTYEIGFDPE